MMLSAVAAATVALAPVPVGTHILPTCDGGSCQVSMTPQQLLAAADRLVAQGRYAEARPLLEALRLAPETRTGTRFLLGMIAYRTGDLKAAENEFKEVLAEDPRQTRVRLELANVFLAMRKSASAERQLRLAAQDVDLPQQVARTIRIARDTIRSSRTWRLDLNVGIAPDTNINNATSAQSIDILIGDTEIPVDLDEQARSRSGTGQFASISAGARLPVSDTISLLGEFDGNGTNYRGSNFDDVVVQGAGGLEYRLSSLTSVSAQAVAASRWFGGNAVTRQIGVRIGGQAVSGGRDRFGFQVDVRRTNALFDRAYDGWQAGVYGTYERAISPTIVASIGPFIRRDMLREDAFSNTEFGGNAGIGGELRHGLNFGASFGLSRAEYDAALPIFDPEPRSDWRLNTRATLGYRKIRVLGFSPQLVWSYTKIDSSLRFYDTSRSRFELTLARYF